MIRLLLGILFVSLMTQGAGMVTGQDYPNKPIRIIAGGVGGSNDFTARLIAQGISGRLGQPVIVENRGGSLLATEAVSKAPPDGYTLIVSGSSLWIFTLLQKAAYDAIRDFSPISLTDRQVGVVAVHPSVPVKSVKELIALAKARPGELNYGAGLSGSPTHLAAELLKSMAGVNIVNVPYKSLTPAITALISGEVHLVITDAGLLMPHVKAGRLRALAVTSAEPSVMAPGLPTVAASGLPGYESAGMVGILAPTKTPGAIINRLNQEIVRVLNLPDVKERYLNAGSEIVGSSPDEFAAVIKADMARTGKVIKAAGIRVE